MPINMGSLKLVRSIYMSSLSPDREYWWLESEMLAKFRSLCIQFLPSCSLNKPTGFYFYLSLNVLRGTSLCSLWVSSRHRVGSIMVKGHLKQMSEQLLLGIQSCKHLFKQNKVAFLLKWEDNEGWFSTRVFMSCWIQEHFPPLKCH